MEMGDQERKDFMDDIEDTTNKMRRFGDKIVDLKSIADDSLENPLNEQKNKEHRSRSTDKEFSNLKDSLNDRLTENEQRNAKAIGDYVAKIDEQAAMIKEIQKYINAGKLDNQRRAYERKLL